MKYYHILAMTISIYIVGTQESSEDNPNPYISYIGCITGKL